MTYTNDQRMTFVMQRAQGKSFDKIADDLGISKQTLIKWQGEMFAQIKEQEFYEVQTITEAYAVTRRQRFDATARTLGAVLAELARRVDTDQLADMATDKLVNLALVLEKRLMQDTGRELVSVHVDKNYDALFGEYIDAD
jgi:glutamate dehydrogenase/leucine dehydrogenase